jgi:hypothetical protein
MKKDSLENIAMRVLTESKIKPWVHLDSSIQDKLSKIWSMHNIGNLRAESDRIRDAAAEIYQLGLSQKTRYNCYGGTSYLHSGGVDSDYEISFL